MKYYSFESVLKTDKSREYLWNKINTPQKVILLENLKEPEEGYRIKKISNNNYEFYFEDKTGIRFTFLTFIPNIGINLTFIVNDDSSLAWFEIKGEESCSIIHGTSVRMDVDKGEWVRKNEENMKKHFLEELEDIAK